MASKTYKQCSVVVQCIASQDARSMGRPSALVCCEAKRERRLDAVGVAGYITYGTQTLVFAAPCKRSTGHLLCHANSDRTWQSAVQTIEECGTRG